MIIRMNTDADNEFRTYLSEHLETSVHDELLQIKYCNCLPSLAPPVTFLMKISNGNLSSDILALIQQFLDTLSHECTCEYVMKADNEGNSIIFVCENMDLLKVVVRYVPNINVQNVYGNNALMRSCVIRSESINLNKIKFLLDCEIDADAKNKNGATALMHCCHWINNYSGTVKDIEEIIELLIFNGANPLIKYCDQKIAYENIINKQLLSVRVVQLLQGEIKTNRTKRAIFD